jgi:5-methylcytosine-specific restriction endonuclease McrA
MQTAERTLVLNRGYEPIQIISWQRAVTLVVLAKVDVVAAYDAWRHPTLATPAVVRLRSPFHRAAPQVKFSRANIYARDRHRCQYCGARCTAAELTFDHVVPRARGGRTSWENIVAACYACNGKKACRTPGEAGMTLRAAPARPRWMPAVQIQVSARSVPEAWRDYLYWTEALEDDTDDGGVGGQRC